MDETFGDSTTLYARVIFDICQRAVSSVTILIRERSEKRLEFSAITVFVQIQRFLM